MNTAKKRPNGEALSIAQRRFLTERVEREVERRFRQIQKGPSQEDRFASLLERLLDLAESSLGPRPLPLASPVSVTLPKAKRTARTRANTKRAAA